MNILKAAGLAAVLVLMGCGSSETSTGDTTTTTGGSDATTSTTTDDGTTTTSTADDPMEGSDTASKTGALSGSCPCLLSNVEIGRHEGFDRVVFTFRGDGTPGWKVEYVDPPITEDASGEVVDIDGDAFLEVRMEPSSTYDMEAGAPVYTGPDELRGSDAGASVIQEVEITGDFEAVLHWVIGISDKVDFKVTTLTNPNRLVVDVRNH
jgi:hypothetical protein